MIDEKVALVTGGSRRIGAAIVRELHGQGLRVAIHYRNANLDAHQLADELNTIRTDSAAVFQADFNQFDQISDLGEAVVRRFGRLDILINNASDFLPSLFEQASDDAFGNLFNVHVKAPYFLTQSVLPELITAGGCVLNITDIYANRQLPNYALYCASKAALASLTKSLALELAPNIRVNAIAPGAILWVENEPESLELISRTPLRRLGDVNDITAAVKYLLFEAKFTTGEVLVIDGGRSHLPA